MPSPPTTSSASPTIAQNNPQCSECSTLRAPLTLPSLGRRRSLSSLAIDPSTPSIESFPLTETTTRTPSPISVPSLPSETSSETMSSMARLAQWLHFNPSHLVFINWSQSTPSEKAQFDEDDSLSLPPPASATRASFGSVFDEKNSHAAQQSHRSVSIHAPIFLVISLLPLSTFLVYITLRTLPITLSSWPRTITDVAQLGRELHGYSQSGAWPLLHVIGVMAITAVWKHAWSIPGAVIWNVIAGALFSTAFATLLLTLLTTIGSIAATLLAAPLAPFLAHFFPKALDMTRSALEGDAGKLSSATAANDNVDPQSKALSSLSTSQSSGAWVRLSVLRLVGVVPWSGINIACGVCNVSLFDCFLGAFIGTLPWTAVTCQIGDILQTVASTPSPTPQSVSSLLLSPAVITKLIVLSFLSLAPILAKDRLKALVSTQQVEDVPPSEKDTRTPRFKWAKGVKGWKMRLPSRSHSRDERERQALELETLVDEKRQLQARDLALLPS